MYDETTHWRLKKPKLKAYEVGEKYVSVAQFKECVTYYALANGFSLWYERSYEAKVVAKCGQRPPRLTDPKKGKQRKHTRWITDEKTFQCISLEDGHTCVRNFNYGSLVNYKWIAKIFDDKIRANPYIKLCDIADLVMKRYKCKVTPNQCTNAKKYALTEYEKTVVEHYAMLRSYGKAILDSNLGSTLKLGVTVNPDGKTYFDSHNQGEILTAIGRDGNKHIYPVAWAAVNVENKDNWTWFLELLLEDLGSSRGNGLTLMSDQHKVLWKLKMSCQMLSTGNVQDIFMKTLGNNTLGFGMVIPAGENLFEVISGSEGFTVDEGNRIFEQIPQPKEVPGRPRKKQSVGDVEDVNVVLRGPVRDEGAGGSRGGASGSRGRGGAGGSREGVGGSRGGASGPRGGASGSRGGASVSRGGVGGSRGGAGRSRGGASGSKRKHVSSAGTQKIR
ncbi:pentatricopeptide repeat-containing protein [Tanacetum coccineum]